MSDRIIPIQNELLFLTHEELQIMVEELEARHQELQATNSKQQAINQAVQNQVAQGKKINQLVDRMPPPEFIEGSANESLALNYNSRRLIAVIINWQWVLAKISESLVTRDTRAVIKLLFSDVDCVQINYNAIQDICSIVRQPVDENAIREAQVKVQLFVKLINKYPYQTLTSQPQLDYIINEFSLIVQTLRNLEVIGLGGFMIAAGFHLALLQKKALLEPKEWSNFKYRAREYSDYAARVTPHLFKLSVGRIDKACQCTRWESGEGSERITEYECRYSDGKDFYIFRSNSLDAFTVSNKHRLQMFYDVTDRTNQTAAKPVRVAIKKWRELAAE